MTELEIKKELEYLRPRKEEVKSNEGKLVQFKSELSINTKDTMIYNMIQDEIDRLEALQNTFIKKVQAAESMIDSVLPVYEDGYYLLRKKYIDGKSWVRIRDEMYISEQTGYRILKRAIKIIQDNINMVVNDSSAMI